MYTLPIITMKWVLWTAHAVGGDGKLRFEILSVFFTSLVYSATKKHRTGMHI